MRRSRLPFAKVKGGLPTRLRGIADQQISKLETQYFLAFDFY